MESFYFSRPHLKLNNLISLENHDLLELLTDHRHIQQVVNMSMVMETILFYSFISNVNVVVIQDYG